MATLEELKAQFLVSSNLSEAKMLSLLQLAIAHCAVDSKGNVDIKSPKLAARDKIMLVLSARYIAHHLDESISMDVTGDELVRNAGVALDQIRARTSDLVRDKQIETPARGTYRVLVHRIDPFLQGLKAS
ncbi:hypothetical protein [Granulicella sp. L46]|uniref:hypothetical protein n=1 Tax=Granulicella sp. L46 TaxID=1641865 RepID=UPI00131DEF0C|nr:hypothetical protein [Granulicella sp. L46]